MIGFLLFVLFCYIVVYIATELVDIYLLLKHEYNENVEVVEKTV